VTNPTNWIPAYAIYFDHKRRTDPEFRKALKRESRRQARAAREEAEAEGAQQQEAIKLAFKEATEEGFPSGIEEKEAFFMSEVAKGEQLCQDGKSGRLLYLAFLITISLQARTKSKPRYASTKPSKFTHNPRT
jgi:mitochondrial import receptor subunit TOM20